MLFRSVFASHGVGAGRSVTQGVTDMELGAKYVLVDGATHRLGLAVEPVLSLPTGIDALTSGAYDPTVKLAWSLPVAAGFSASGNANLARVGDELGRYTETMLTAAAGHDLPGGFSGFWEVYGSLASGRPGAAAWNVDTGVTHLLAKAVQVDVEVGRGLTGTATDWFVGAGIGIRAPRVFR